VTMARVCNWGKADIDQVAATNREFMSTRPSSMFTDWPVPWAKGCSVKYDLPEVINPSRTTKRTPAPRSAVSHHPNASRISDD
jgi:hypothetical protein